MYDVLFEERHDEKYSIVLKNEFIAHITIEESVDIKREVYNGIESTNNLKIFVRENLDDNFKYEAIFYEILERCNLKNHLITIHVFEDISHISLLQLLCDFVHHLYNRQLCIEINQDHFIIFENQEILIKSFVL